MTSLDAMQHENSTSTNIVYYHIYAADERGSGGPTRCLRYGFVLDSSLGAGLPPTDPSSAMSRLEEECDSVDDLASALVDSFRELMARSGAHYQLRILNGWSPPVQDYIEFRVNAREAKMAYDGAFQGRPLETRGVSSFLCKRPS